MHVSAVKGDTFTIHIGGLTAAGIATDNLPAGVVPTLTVSDPTILSLDAVVPDPADAKMFIVHVTMLADSGDAIITAVDANLTPGSITVTATPAPAVALELTADAPATVVVDTPPAP